MKEVISGRAGFTPATRPPLDYGRDKPGPTVAAPLRRGYQRCSRIDYGSASSAFAVTICIKPRRPVFTSADRVEPLLAHLRELQSEGYWGVHVYCVMSDHVHLVVVTPGNRGLPEAVRRFKGRMSVTWRACGDGTPLWQPGFFDHRIRGSEGFEEKCLYVLANPVRAGLVNRSEDYPWSGVWVQR